MFTDILVGCQPFCHRKPTSVGCQPQAIAAMTEFTRADGSDEAVPAPAAPNRGVVTGKLLDLGEWECSNCTLENPSSYVCCVANAGRLVYNVGSGDGRDALENPKWAKLDAKLIESAKAQQITAAPYLARDVAKPAGSQSVAAIQGAKRRKVCSDEKAEIEHGDTSMEAAVDEPAGLPARSLRGGTTIGTTIQQLT